MTMKNFIPTVWSARILANLDKALVAKGMVNTDYQGEINDAGDTVKINQFGNVTIKPYTGKLEAPDELTSTQQTLVIDKYYSYNLRVDDIQAAQANVNIVEGVAERAAFGMAKKIDEDIFETQAKEAGIKVGTTVKPIELTAKNIYDEIVDLGVKLNEKNVPKSQRTLVLPPFAIGLLAKDQRFTKQETVLASGVVGRVGGFDIIESNSLKTSGAVTAAIGGWSQATTFASNVVKTETVRAADSFSDILRGLNVYGLKVTHPEALAVFYIKEATAQATE